MNQISPENILSLLGAIPAAALGGASFLRGVIGVAAVLRLPRLLVATTLAAFATSSPELAVSSLAALSGQPGIGLGDALGSNVVNLGLILGIGLMFGPIPARFADIRRDFVVALCVPVLIFFLALDGSVSRVDGSLLLGLFVLWMGLVARQALAHRRDAPPATGGAAPGAVSAWLYLLFGLGALLLAGRLFVAGASGIATAMGVHPYVVGAILVSAGTSLPELVTVLISRLRGHDDVGLGTLLGSNLFNGLAVVGVAATLHPIHVPPGEIGVAVAFGVISILLVRPHRDAISRGRGLAMLGSYVLFVLATMIAAI